MTTRNAVASLHLCQKQRRQFAAVIRLAQLTDILCESAYQTLFDRPNAPDSFSMWRLLMLKRILDGCPLSDHPDCRRRIDELLPEMLVLVALHCAVARHKDDERMLFVLQPDCEHEYCQTAAVARQHSTAGSLDHVRRRWGDALDHNFGFLSGLHDYLQRWIDNGEAEKMIFSPLWQRFERTYGNEGGTALQRALFNLRLTLE